MGIHGVKFSCVVIQGFVALSSNTEFKSSLFLCCVAYLHVCFSLYRVYSGGIDSQ